MYVYLPKTFDYIGGIFCIKPKKCNFTFVEFHKFTKMTQYVKLAITHSPAI